MHQTAIHSEGFRSLREVRPAARFPHDVAAIIKDLSPRILQVMRRVRCEMSPLFTPPLSPALPPVLGPRRRGQTRPARWRARV